MKSCEQYGLSHKWEPDLGDPTLEWCPNCGEERACVVKLPKSAIDAWACYDPPEFKHPTTAIRDAFMSGFIAAARKDTP